MISELANQMYQLRQKNAAHFQEINVRLDGLETRVTNLESKVATTETKLLHLGSRPTSTVSGPLKCTASKPYDRPPASVTPKPPVESPTPQHGSNP